MEITGRLEHLISAERHVNVTVPPCHGVGCFLLPSGATGCVCRRDLAASPAKETTHLDGLSTVGAPPRKLAGKLLRHLGSDQVDLVILFHLDNGGRREPVCRIGMHPNEILTVRAAHRDRHQALFDTNAIGERLI